MDIKVGDRVRAGTVRSEEGEVVAILNADVPFPVVVQFGRPGFEYNYAEYELEVIS